MSLRWGSLALLLLAACHPEFKSSGTLSVQGSTFTPTVCHVTVNPAGMELRDAAGNRLELGIPPQTLEAWKELRNVPQTAWEPAGGRRVELGPCGSLVMRGEGYHAECRRAASGRVMLSCPGASGELEFSGCF